MRAKENCSNYLKFVQVLLRIDVFRLILISLPFFKNKKKRQPTDINQLTKPNDKIIAIPFPHSTKAIENHEKQNEHYI